MLKFIRGKSQQPSAERQKLQRELFSFRKTIQHGFPNRPTALAWDPELRIFAIGTANGVVKVFGKPGVEFCGKHKISDKGERTDLAVTKIVFIPNEGRLVTLLEDNTLHLWKTNESELEQTNSITMEGKLKKVSSTYLENSKKNLLLGTEGGNVYYLNLELFDLSDHLIYQDILLQSVLTNMGDGYKVHPGAVEAILEQPGNPNVVLVGYTRGLMVLWNIEKSICLQAYINHQQLEGICWDFDGTRFISAHNDGSFVLWDADGADPVGQPNTPYGPFPCKAITKIEWRSEEDVMVFAGGMPRSNYGDKNTITVEKSDKKIAFDFTSKIVDFFTISSKDENKTCECLIALAEEELVAIDLRGEDEWRMIELPYLNSLHASAVTFSTHVSDVSPSLWDDLQKVSIKQKQGLYSSMEWPIDGGLTKDENDSITQRDLLITGHEDGAVKFWNAGSASFSLIYTLKTNTIFDADFGLGQSSAGDNLQDDEEDEWPPFKKVGCFDPYSDDPRLAIKKVSLCCITGVLAVAGTAGQLVVCKLSDVPVVDHEVKSTVMNIVGERDSFVWKGHSRLVLRNSTSEDSDSSKLTLPPGYQPSSVLQINPPAAITSLALHSDWSIVSVGTAHGLAIFDYLKNMPVLLKCTLNPNDMSGLNEPPISRTKSFKKSLRESFRRLRKGRSTRQSRPPDKRQGRSPTSSSSAIDRRRLGGLSSPSGQTGDASAESRPVERAIEARPVDDALGSMVRCLYFAQGFVITTQHSTPTLWAGTNNGTVYIFVLGIPPISKRSQDRVTGQLGKEIQLKHRAPVIGLTIIDAACRPLPEPFEVEKGLCKRVDTSSTHHVIIASEEQFKVFSLPYLKPVCKLKLTAMEGARIRRVATAWFSTQHHVESCLVCLTNIGDLVILSVPELRRQLTASVMRREDISGISSLTFTKYGEAIYMHSCSEMQRISLSTMRKTMTRCHLLTPITDDDNSKISKDTKKTSADSITNTHSRISSLPPLPQLNAHSVISMGIPEEDEDEQESPEEKINDVRTSPEGCVENGNMSDDGNQSTHNHDVSAITVDSVKDHIASLTTDEETVNTTVTSITTTTTNTMTDIITMDVTKREISVNNNDVSQLSTTIESS